MIRVLLSIGILQALTILVGLARAKGLAVLLGPAHFGVVSTIDQVVLTLVSLGGFSLTFTAVKFLSRSHSESQEAFERAGASFLRATGILAVLTTVVASALLAWSPGIFGADLARYQFIIQLALLGIPAVMLNILFVNTLAAAQRPAAAAGLNLVVASGLAAAAILGVRMRGLTGLYLATGVLGFVGLLSSISYLRRAVGLHLRRGSPQLWHELRQSPEIISYSGYVYLATSTYMISMMVVRYVVLSSLGEAPAGMLQASLSIALTVGAILTPMSNLYLTPLLNRASPATDKIRAANEFASKMLVLLLLGALPIVLFPGLLVGLLYSRGFAGAVGTVFLFVLWQCVYQIANVYQQLLIGLDDVLFMALSAAVGYASAATLAGVLVPKFGLGGAAVGLAAGMLLYGIAAAVRLRSRHGIGIPLRVAGRTGYVVVAVLIAGLLFGTRPEGPLLGIGLRVGFAGLVGALMWLQLDPAERQLVTRAPALLRRLWQERGQTPAPAA